MYNEGGDNMILKLIKKALASYQDRQELKHRTNRNRKQFRLAHQGLEERGY